MTEAALIEPARSEDASSLRAIADECGLHIDVEAELSRPYAIFRVARGAAGVHGFLLAWRAADELHLTDLGVTQAARRRGLARALVQALLVEGQGMRVVLLEVRESNAAALALYGGLGFEELDRRPRYYSDTDEDAVVMSLNLG